MPFAELRHARVFYEMGGASGPPVLLIAGTGGNISQPPGPFSWPGADAFSLLAYDHRDLGQSTGRSEQPTMEDFAGDALELVNHLGWDRFSVVGTSFGGMVAQELALAAGPRLRRLVLVGTSMGGPSGHSYPLHELYALSPSARTARLVELLDTRATFRPTLAEQIESFLAADSSFATQGAPSAGLLRQLEARRQHNMTARLGQLDVPTLVAAGRFDGIAPLSTTEMLAAAIPRSRLAIFDGGHGFLLQDATAWPSIVEFLRGGLTD